MSMTVSGCGRCCSEAGRGNRCSRSERLSLGTARDERSGQCVWMSAKCARLKSRRFVPGQEQRMRRMGGVNKGKRRAAEIILWAVAVASFAGVTTAQQAAPSGQAAGGAQAAVAQSVGTVKA